MKLNLSELREWVQYEEGSAKEEILQLIDIAEVSKRGLEQFYKCESTDTEVIEDTEKLEEYREKFATLLKDVEVSDAD